MSLYDKIATAAMLHNNIQNPPTHIIERAVHYNVSPGTAPTFVSFTGTTSRFTIQHNTGGIGIGDGPYAFTFYYRRIGNPEGVISIGLRKAAGDTFTLIAQHPVTDPKRSGLITVDFSGTFRAPADFYQMVANDKVSLEYPPDNTNTIEIACGTGLPSGFTSQQYTGSYAATTNPLAVKITSRVLTPI